MLFLVVLSSFVWESVKFESLCHVDLHRSGTGPRPIWTVIFDRTAGPFRQLYTGQDWAFPRFIQHPSLGEPLACTHDCYQNITTLHKFTVLRETDRPFSTQFSLRLLCLSYNMQTNQNALAFTFAIRRISVLNTFSCVSYRSFAVFRR